MGTKWLTPRRRPSPGLLSALAVVEGLPRRTWDESDADGPGALSARAYNSGLWEARQAIKRAIEEAP